MGQKGAARASGPRSEEVSWWYRDRTATTTARHRTATASITLREWLTPHAETLIHRPETEP
jgi:hypothetical protein